MKERAAATKSMNLRQSTMTQEFEAVANRLATVEPLPLGWIRIWDNPGGRHYFFNTVDHDIQKDLTHIHAKVALNAMKLTEEEKGSDNDVPDAAASASRNAIISPSPVLSRKRKSAPRDARMTYSGTVDMSFTSPDDEEVSGDDTDSKSETDIESWKGETAPITRLYKKHNKMLAKKVPSNETVASIIPRVLS
jgi:hypothetical protein